MRYKRYITLYLLIICVLFYNTQCSLNYPVQEVNGPASNYGFNEAYAQNPQKLQEIKKRMDNLTRWLEIRTRRPTVPSAAVLVMQNNKCIYKKAVNSSYDSLYEVASITKIFIALAILQLVDEGEISLDDPIRDYLTVILENSNLETVPITIRHILTHTSGLADGPGPNIPGENHRIMVPTQKYPAGVRFNYSNQAYNVLALVIPAVTKMPLHEYIQKRVLAPMEMNDSKADHDILGSAGLKCSINDLGNFLTMLMNQGEFKGREIVSESMFNEIFRRTYFEPPAKYHEYRGISFRVWTINDKIYSYHHSAHMNGSGGWMQIFPSQKVGYIFISNPPVYDTEKYYSYYRSLKYRMMVLAGKLINDSVSPDEFRLSRPNRNEMKKFIGRYVKHSNGTYVDVVMTNNGLIARKSKTSHRVRILPTSKHTFVYIYPGQSERGEIFDFICNNDGIVALGVRDGYYKKIETLNSHASNK